MRSLVSGGLSARDVRHALEALDALGHAGVDSTRLCREFGLERAAHFLLRRTSIAEVSFLLGYSDPSLFHRAFKRWFGMSPERYRRQYAGATRGSPAERAAPAPPGTPAPPRRSR